MSRDCVDAYVEAAQNAGYPYNDDYNGADQEGMGYFQMTAHNGRRCSSAVAYLRSAKGRDNLAILTNRTTKQVLTENGKATGIQVDHNGKTETITARNEVILCAGALGSPL